jgi:hypothetical protein
LKAEGHNRINVQNNPINGIDPLGLRWSIGSSGGVLIADYGWDSSNPSQGLLSVPIGQLAGGGWHVNWTSDNNQGSLVNGQTTSTPFIWSVGLGKYFGISFADDFSSFSFNLGWGAGLPISAAIPLEGDYSFGGWLYDVLHPEQPPIQEPRRYKVPKLPDDPC